MTGSLEMGKFLQKQSVLIFEQLRMRCISLVSFGSFGNKEKRRIAAFFASLPFITYLCNERLKPSIHCVQLLRKIAQIARLLSK